MGAVLTRARAELRARIQPMLALILLVGLGSAAVMTLAAGARRTDTAYPRFARAYKAADMLVYPSFEPGVFAQLDFNKVAHLPEVAASAIEHFLFADQQAGVTFSYSESPYGSDIDRSKLLEGRLPHADNPEEVLVSPWVAKSQHLHVGSSFTTEFHLLTDQVKPFRFRVVGIEAAPGEFPPQITGNGPSTAGTVVHLTKAGYSTLVDAKVFGLDWLLIRLKGGAAAVKGFNDTLNDMAINPKTGQHLPQLNDNLNEQGANVQRSIHLQAVALWLVAGVAALIIILVLSQLIARQATLDSSESPTLQALGMTRSQIWLTGMLRALVIGIVGAGIGVGVAYLASAFMPIGIARIAEPQSGFSFDAFLLIVAGVAVVCLVLLLAAWPIWKGARAIRKEARLTARPSLASRSAAAPGFPPSMATGVRLALESGRGRTEVPVRSSLLSVVLAIAALAGALTFGASLNHLLDTPRLYGWNWDVHLTTSDANDNQPAYKVLSPDPRVEDIAALDNPPLILNDKIRFDIIALDQIKGAVEPIIARGRVPRLPTEVALGQKTMAQARVKLGDTVQLHISAIADSPDELFKLVGVVVLPTNSDTARLGSGAYVTEQGIRRMVPHGFQIPAASDLYFSFAPGVNKKAALADIMSTTTPVQLFSSNGPTEVKSEKLSQAYSVVPPSKPTDLVNFGNVQNLPLLLAGLVGLLAAATLAHTLVTSIRRRRRDLAILKMLGFVPRQVRIAVAWQATTFVCAALLIGLPVGIALGRVVWSAFATNLGTVPEPVTPSLRIILTIPGAIFLANVIAIVPAFIAGRMRPAPALRTE